MTRSPLEQVNLAELLKSPGSDIQDILLVRSLRESQAICESASQYLTSHIEQMHLMGAGILISESAHDRLHARTSHEKGLKQCLAQEKQQSRRALTL